MGSRMVTKLLNEGYEVVVWNRTPSKVEDLKFKIQKSKFKNSIQNLKVGKSIQDLVNQLDKPRIVWLMLPAGEATQEILNQVQDDIESGDILIDGGNSKHTDTQKRFEHFSSKNIRFLGIGVSGGLIAAREGYPLMVGGDRSAYDHIKPILGSLARPKGGHEYFGEGGAGHFVKMVHNGIEYGLMQSIGEGFGVLEKSPYRLDLLKVAKIYQKNTLSSGFMMQRTIEALEKDPNLGKIEGYIESSGEGEWTIEEAKRQNLPIGIIEESFEFRKKSQKDKNISSSFAARLVAALRNAFGGHEVKSRLKSKD